MAVGYSQLCLPASVRAAKRSDVWVTLIEFPDLPVRSAADASSPSAGLRRKNPIAQISSSSYCQGIFTGVHRSLSRKANARTSPSRLVVSSGCTSRSSFPFTAHRTHRRPRGGSCGRRPSCRSSSAPVPYGNFRAGIGNEAQGSYGGHGEIGAGCSGIHPATNAAADHWTCQGAEAAQTCGSGQPAEYDAAEDLAAQAEPARPS